LRSLAFIVEVSRIRGQRNNKKMKPPNLLKKIFTNKKPPLVVREGFYPKTDKNKNGNIILS